MINKFSKPWMSQYINSFFQVYYSFNYAFVIILIFYELLSVYLIFFQCAICYMYMEI